MVEPVDIQHITRAVAVSRSCSHDAPLCWHANLLPVRSGVLLLRTVTSARYGSTQFHIKEVAHRSQRVVNILLRLYLSQLILQQAPSEQPRQHGSASLTRIGLVQTDGRFEITRTGPQVVDSSSYQYQPLPSDHHIRCLILEPGTGEDSLIGSM